MNKIKKTPRISNIHFAIFIMALFLISSLFFGEKTCAATLSLTPNGGTYEIGSTFDVSIMLNTEGKSVNAVKASLSFPANILQVTSPSAGQSVVALWASPPTYSNSAGTISLEGGFPNGINVSNGLITKITFRVKGTGMAIIKFKDDSKVLLDDGKGTGALSQTNNGIYTLSLPPPAGPEVISETHPDQSRWYSNSVAALKWVDPDPDPDLIEEYSYALSDNPSEIPDDISEGDKNSVVYKNISDGRHYFHIKALNRDKIWGGTTHYALNIDSTLPAEFSIDIFPSSSTARRNPVIQFATTDGQSGMDHYNLKIVPLNDNYAQVGVQDEQRMFIEANSPYLAQNLELGNYDVIVRAYDAAGNYRDSIKRLKITNAVFQFVSDEGVVIRGESIIPWFWFFLAILVIMAVLTYVVWRLKHWHWGIEQARNNKRLPLEIQQKMKELKQLKKKYKELTAVVILIMSGLFWNISVKAEDVSLKIEPPLITTISKNISNNEIFYVGGKAETDGEKITIYIKNAKTGETFSEEISTDSKGEWFYRHDAFLSDGDYVLWAQSKIGGQLSPPSPQTKMTVNKTALQLGASRISYEMLLSLVAGILFVILLVLIFYVGLFARKIRKKNRLFKKEVREVEDAVHKGFMMLHREIAKELKLIEKINSKKALSERESEYRDHLMNDLKKIERHIEKEILDVERLLN